MDEIIAYLQTKYAPAAILVYGSFADGTQNENSDFDALVLSPTHREFHDTSFVGEIQWCKKMLLRAKRSDAEGAYRWHWLLTESPEIFCDIAGYPYLGPKKSLRYLQKQFPKAFRCYTQALTDFRYDTLKAWIDCMEKTRTQSDSI